MCSLFGVLDTQGVLSARQLNRILTVLSRECQVRGTDATGIAYNHGGRLRIYKRPLPADKLVFHVPGGTRVVMGHTRMATQGKPQHNFNNHPWAAKSFALAHNGILRNDKELRRSEHLPFTRIQTDSYVAVQLLEQEKALSLAAMQHMAEKVQGSFVFTVLGRDDSLYFVRGDNPLAIFCYNGFLLYASTNEILCAAEHKLHLRHHAELCIKEGDILRIDKTGQQSRGHFLPHHSLSHFWRQSCYEDWFDAETDVLLEAAHAMGVPHDDIQLLLDCGFDTDEIEALLYDPYALRELVCSLRCDLL